MYVDKTCSDVKNIEMYIQNPCHMNLSCTHRAFYTRTCTQNVYRSDQLQCFYDLSTNEEASLCVQFVHNFKSPFH